MSETLIVPHTNYLWISHSYGLSCWLESWNPFWCPQEAIQLNVQWLWDGTYTTYKLLLTCSFFSLCQHLMMLYSIGHTMSYDTTEQRLESNSLDTTQNWQSAQRTVRCCSLSTKTQAILSMLATTSPVGDKKLLSFCFANSKNWVSEFSTQAARVAMVK